MRADIERRFPLIETVRIHGQAVRAAYRPGDGVPLVLCNGWGSNIEIFDDLVAALPGRPVLRFDVPGTGGSPRTPVPWRPSRIASLVEALWRHYGLERVDVFGYSWGGAPAQELARRNPKAVRRLVLAATTTGHAMVPARPSIIPAFLDHRWLTNWRQPSRFFGRDFACRVGPRLFGGERLRRDPTAVLPLLDKLEQPSAVSMLWQVGGTVGWTSVPWLRRLTQPTLILAGRDDRVVNPVNALILRTLIPGARLRWMTGGHLFPVLDDVEGTAAMIRDFTGDDDKVIPFSGRWRQARRGTG